MPRRDLTVGHREFARQPELWVHKASKPVIRSALSAVAEALAEEGVFCKLRILGHPDRFAPAGLAEDLMHEAGIDEEGILSAIVDLVDAPPVSDGAWGDHG